MSESAGAAPANTAAASFRGGCPCGAVRHEVRGPPRPVVAVHVFVDDAGD